MLQDTIHKTPVGTENRVIALISTGHFLSHFYALTLPAMFPTLKAAFGVSYVELGLILTAYNLLGGLVQAPMGFVVDTLGPRRVLLVGLGLNALAIALIGLASAYWIILVLALIAGLGNSVFHPANYSILSGSIDERRLGRAFSVHTFMGFLGSACAPAAMLAIAAFTDWQTAFLVVGIAGLVVLGIMLLSSADFVGESRTSASDDGTGQSHGLKLLLSPSILLFLCFFVAYGLAAGGLVAFTASTLINLHGLSIEWANWALTGHLFGVVGGVVLAGIVVDRFKRHIVSAAVALLLGMAFVLMPTAVTLPGAPLVAIMTIAGMCLGAVLPPRDLMVRAATPSGQTGKVFGFVFVGYTVGASITPVLFGWLLDTGRPSAVFVFAAVFLLLALAALTAAQRRAVASRPSHP